MKLIALFISLTLAGCAHTHVEKVATINQTTERSTIAPAPRDGMYHVKLTAGHHFHAQLFDADQYFRKGDLLGFRRGDDGAMIAIANGRETNLGRLPPRVTHLMWFAKSNSPTRFGTSMRAFVEVAEKGGILAGIAAVYAGEIYLESLSAADDDVAMADGHHSGRRVHRQHH